MSWLEHIDARRLGDSLASAVPFTITSDLTYDDVGHGLAIASGPAELGIGARGDLWDRFKKEFFLLVCEADSKYNDLRKKLDSMSGHAADALVAIIATKLAIAIGTTALIVSPMVTLMLLASARIGKDALCSSRTLERPIEAPRNSP
jgi:hypothetical protein